MEMEIKFVWVWIVKWLWGEDVVMILKENIDATNLKSCGSDLMC